MIAEIIMAVALSTQPKYKVGDCLQIDKIIMNIKVVEVREGEYFCTYWIPWLHKYAPAYMLSFELANKPNVHKIKCEIEGRR